MTSINRPNGVVLIRAYAALDLRQTYGVFYQAVHHGAAGHYSQTQRNAWAPSPQPRANWGQRMSNMTTLVAQRQGDIIGFMGIEQDGHLDMVFVRPDVMGTGIAQALYDALIALPDIAALPRLCTEASLLARPFFAKNHWHVEHQEFHPHNGEIFERFRMSLAQ